MKSNERIDSTDPYGPDGMIGPEDTVLLRVLGSGASGVVLLGARPGGRLVAVKRLAGSWENPTALARFRRESRILLLLDHPHIVRSEGRLTDGDEAWIVMEYIDGPTLQKLLDGLPLSTSNALAVLEAVSSALTYAHAQGVLHRDLTPANVLFDSSGRPLLADFGVAKLMGPDLQTSLLTFQTHTGALVGTPTYMSPEAAEGTGDLTVRSDVYSLGVLAYRLLVGRTPFPSTGNVLDVLSAQIHEAAPPPSTVGVQLPPLVEAALLRALEKDPELRPSSVVEYWKELAAGADESWPDWRGRADLEGTVRQASVDVGRGPPGTTEVDVAPRLTGQSGTGVGDLPDMPLAPLVTNRINIPAFTPRHRRRWPGMVAAVLVAVAASIAAVSLSRPSTRSLDIESMSLESIPSTHPGPGCPQRFVVTGTILTNGAGGTFRYQWYGANSREEPVRVASIESGRQDVTVMKEVSVGSARDIPTVGLRVLPPFTSMSGPVSIELRCGG